MSYELVSTKLHIPRVRAAVVPRPRLDARLADGLQRTLTLVSAPAGYGKTTLVVAGLERAGMPCTWLALDENDNDLARFLSYVIAALQKINAGIGQSTEHLLREMQGPVPAALMITLINEIAGMGEPCALVLDDYHVIQSQPVHAAIEFLLEHQPPDLHLVMITRQDPPFALAQLRVRAAIAEIRADDLRFTLEEAAQFFAQTMKLDLDAAAVRALETRTEGWIAGLQLAALSVQGRREVQAFAEQFSGTHRYVIDYLVEQVLQRQSESVRRFLVRTSILDRLCASLCDAVLKPEETLTPSAAQLDYLEHANLFLIPLDDEKRWYRYHQLFADSLRTELDAQEQGVLHRRAAEWYAAHGLGEESVQHAYRAKDFALVARLILEYAPAKLDRGQVTTLVEWLRLLPPEILRADNALVTYMAYSLFFSGQAAAAFQLIDQALTHNGLDSATRGRLLALRAWSPSLQNDATTREAARAALALIEPQDSFSRILALLPLGLAQRAEGDLDTSTRTFRKAYQLGPQSGSPLAMLGALFNLAFNLSEQGKRSEALALCEDALARLEEQGGASFALAGIVHVPLAALHYAGNNLEQARRDALKGLELSRQSIAATILGGDAELILAQVHFARGETENALAVIRAAREATRRAGVARVVELMNAAEADFCLRAGDVDTAARWADAVGFAPQDEIVRTSHMHRLVYARLLMAQGRRRDAEQVVDRFENYARRQGRHTWLIHVFILQAEMARHFGDPAKMTARLEQAVRFAAPENYCRVFLDRAQTLADVLPRVRDAAPAFIDQLAAAFGLSNEKPGTKTDLRAESLSEREFEILKLLAKGMSNREIAQKLVITVGTTKWHLNHIFGKLGVKNRTEAIVRARELKIT